MQVSASTSEMSSNSALKRLKEFSSDFFPESWKTLLTGVVAFVDVRSGSDNRSKSIETEMEKLGATVVKHFSKKVTHVIFKDGSKPIYDKAKSLGIPILSYLWVVACKDKGEMVPTKEYPAINSQDYDNPYFKWRKVKSMQPKDLDEEMKLVEQKLARRRKKAVLKEGLFLKDDEESASLSFTPTIERKSAIDYLVESSPLIQERIHEELASGKSYDQIFTLKEGEEDDFDTYFDTPLMFKFIARNYYSPRDPPPPSIRRILADVKRQSVNSSSPSSPVAPDINKGSLRPPVEETNRPLVGSPINGQSQTGNKRKTGTPASSASKKRKENIEDTEEKPLRRKLLFQPRLAFPCPEDPLVALTPDESPKSSRHKHPCFSQAAGNDQQAQEPILRRLAATCISDKEVAKRRTTRRQTLAPFGSSSPKKSPRRDSWADFKLSSPKKRLEPKIKASLVCTSVHSSSIPVIEEAIERLKGFKMAETVSDTTTHVVCGDARRTINVMRAVVRGAKIVTLEWVTDSASAGRWLDEDDYPVERFSVAAARYRQAGKSSKLFKDYPSIYVSSKSVIPQRDLCDLIRCSGGHVTNVWKQAALIVGQHMSQANAPCVNGTWVLDCIEKGLSLPLVDYYLTNS